MLNFNKQLNNLINFQIKINNKNLFNFQLQQKNKIFNKRNNVMNKLL